LRRLTDFYLEAGAKGLFANCLSSEMFHLTEPERLLVVETVVAQTNGKVPVLASGTFGRDLAKNVSFTAKLVDLGVHTSVIITNQLCDQEADEEVFTAVVEELLAQAGEINFGLYECPVPHKRLLSPNLLKLLGETGHFTYHKDTSCDLDQIERKLQATQGTRLNIFNANTPTALASVQKGAAGVSPIAGNFFPELFAHLMSRIDVGEEVSKLNRLITILDEITGNQYYPLSAKIFLQMRGLAIEPITRTPTPELAKQDFIKLQAMLDSISALADDLGIDLVLSQRVKENF
ncbi:MAG: dihydrodipicolinate synthase family protein, partial [Bacteroidota bacterium]